MTAWLLVLVPVATAVAVAAARRLPRAQAPLAVAGLVATAVVGIAAAVGEATATLGWGPRLGLGLDVVGFSRVMVVLAPVVATPIVAYAAATEPEGRTRLLTFMVAFVGAMELLVAAEDFLTLLIGWELVGALSWALVGQGWRTAGNVKAATEAFLTTRFGDLGLYVAAGIAFAGTGSFRFSDLGRVTGSELDAVAFGVLLAAAAKSAQLPFSPWLFSAMAGPTPVSALLHSSTMVAAGAYLLIRLAPALEATGWFEPAVLALGLATALAGGVVATLQTHAKRVLAGSTSAQYGLMLAAIGAGSTAAAGAQLVTHAAFKSLLFLSAGVASHAVGHADLRGMHLGDALPRASLLSAVGALALAAVPPLGGAWSKEEIVGAVAGDVGSWPAVAIFVAAFLSTLYASRYWILAYGPEPRRGRIPNPLSALGVGRRQRPAPRHLLHLPGHLELASLGSLAAVTLVLSVLWLPGGGRIVEELTAGRLPGSEVVVREMNEQIISLGVIVAAVAVVWSLIRHARLASSGMRAPIRTRAANWFELGTAARTVIVTPVRALSQALARLDAGSARVVRDGVGGGVLTLSRQLARFDDHIIDAGVRATAAVAAAFSRLLSWRGELSIDGVVESIAGLSMRAAVAARVSDERTVDAAVEGIAREVGFTGRQSRKIQTGLAHHYYVMVAAGLAVALVMLAFAR